MKKKLKNVLLIDDDDDDNFFHRLALEESGMTEQVRIAESGEEALTFFSDETFRPELIFLDINMPKINGWDFLEEFGKSSKSFHPVIIILTTSMHPADQKKANELIQPDFIVIKPLTIEKLQSIITRCFPELQ